MSSVRFAFPEFHDLSARLLLDPSRESCAVGFARFSSVGECWVVTDVETAPERAYERRDHISAVLTSTYLVEIANRARKDDLSVILIHTHPHAKGVPEFSCVDDDGEISLLDFFSRRAPAGNHLAMVIGPEGVTSRRLGTHEEILVWEIGENLEKLSRTAGLANETNRHDRQVRAFGAPGQEIMRSLRVGIVGAGGTGSAVLQQLAYLGVSDFTLIEPDTVEETNLNRLIGASPADLGVNKLTVAKREIQRINPVAKVESHVRDVVDIDVSSKLTALDFIFICTDSHASRAIVGQLAYQYLIPTIDMGVSVTVKNGGVTNITGRVQMLAPGLPCLLCTGALNSEQIRRELLTSEQKAADPYIIGVHEPQPAVVSINTTLSSLAVTMFLGAVTPIRASARFQMYDGVRGTVRLTTATRDPNCIVCSKSGALCQGSAWPLPGRQVRQK